MGLLPPSRKHRLRQQALDWLRAELQGRAKLLEARQPLDTYHFALLLARLFQDSDLARVRDGKSLSKLLPSEQQAWQKLWADAAELLKQTQACFRATALKGTLTAEQTEQVHQVKWPRRSNNAAPGITR
jgi:hypothetical protein